MFDCVKAVTAVAVDPAASYPPRWVRYMPSGALQCISAALPHLTGHNQQQLVDCKNSMISGPNALSY